MLPAGVHTADGGSWFCCWQAERPGGGLYKDCWLVLMLDSALLESEIMDADKLFELYLLMAMKFMIA